MASASKKKVSIEIPRCVRSFLNNRAIAAAKEHGGSRICGGIAAGAMGEPDGGADATDDSPE